nr:type II toxin-antitoxin system RelB/DinJ family antitoxin [uncultured Lachnoanaerobaculum sp.]
MASTIQVRVEDELKSKSDALFKDLGTDTTTAIRIFLTQAVAINGFPFEIKRQIESNPYLPLNEKELLEKLKRSREQKKFRDADDVISDMRSKYGL